MKVIECQAEVWVDLFAISFGLWILLGLYKVIKVQQLIVSRYQNETNLLSTIFFTEDATFTRQLPNFFSSAIYAAHLLMCVWGWRIYRRKKVFKDITDPAKITNKFSRKEIRKVKLVAICDIVALCHLIALFGLKLLFPECFT